MSIRVTFNRNTGEFLAKSSFEERTIMRTAGFSFDSNRKLWFSYEHTVAARLREYLDEPAKSEINRVLLSHSPFSGRIPFPANLQPLPFQLEAAKFALARNRSYIGADPGLGKTIIAALIMNALPAVDFAYICPPFLVANVENELQKWLMNPVRGPKIIRDSMLHSDDTQDQIYEFVERAERQGRKSFLIVDEAHRFKNVLSAKRAKHLFGYIKRKTNEEIPAICKLFDRVCYLSGTPMPNRPMELYSVFSTNAPETIGFMSRFDYGRRYCAGYHDGFGWNFDGASHVDDLKRRTAVDWPEYAEQGENLVTSKKFMLRVKKKHLNLPPKLEELVLIDDDLPAKVGDMDRDLLKKFGGDDLMKAILTQSAGKDELHVSTYRKELGIAKAVSSIQFIKSVLDDTDESIIVAFWHKDAGAQLRHELKRFDPVWIGGDTKPADRVRLASDFQLNPKKRVVLLQMIAGGLGLNMPKADRVIFVEFDWVPGNNDQVADRADRIKGRKSLDSLLCQYLVFRNSIDRVVMEEVLRKRRTTEKY